MISYLKFVLIELALPHLVSRCRCFKLMQLRRKHDHDECSYVEKLWPYRQKIYNFIDNNVDEDDFSIEMNYCLVNVCF